MEKARCFFREWFPDWKDADYQCESWLLSPKLREILPDSSRIILFQNAFDLLQVDSEDKGALEWVFQIAGGQAQHVKLEELPEKTLLQRSLKEKLLQGIAPGSARGRLARLFV